MSKTKKAYRNDESEESSSSSSDSSDDSSSSEQSDSSNEKAKRTNKSKKLKLKHKKKNQTSSSSSSEASNSGSEASTNAKKKKQLKHDKASKHSRLDKEQEHDNRNHNKNSHNRKTSHECESNNWPTATERSRWDSPNREAVNDEYDRRRGYNNYNRNGNNFRYYDRNRDRSGYRRNDMNRSRRDWRNENNRNRYDRNEQIDRNRERRSPEKRGRYNENEAKNRRSQERRPYNREGNERRRDDRQDRERRRSRSESPRRPRKFPRRSEEDNRAYEWGKKEDNQKREGSANDAQDPADKEKPNFGLSGKLTEDTNKVNGIVIKYAEPPEARKPKRRWRLYPFKGEKALQTLYIHRQSCYLIGRDRKVCDLPVDHPSCSKQHAALQYRLVPYEKEDGTVGKRVRPYLIDLDSANSTFLNNKPIEARKYVELLEKDVIKFGFSSREYVLLHENSKEEEQDDDVQVEEIQIKEEPAD